MIVLQNDTLCVTVSPVGAEMQSVRDARRVERIWQGDPSFWTGRAPVLFPIAGKLKDNTYLLDGQKHTLPQHGFARGRAFSVEHAAPDAATFLLRGDGSEPGFPYLYALRVRYSLQENAIRVEYTVDNLDTKAFWYGVGAHEAYACPEGICAYALEFEKEETLTRRVLSGGLLTGETELVRNRCKLLPVEPSLFENDTQVYSSLASRAVTLRSVAHERTVRVEFPDFDYLLIWTKPGAGFLCIEPWSNLPDFIDTDQDIMKKPGIAKLSPGETRSHAHTITFA